MMMMEFEWDANKAGINLMKHGVSFDEGKSMNMKKIENEMEDELRPEYDLQSLRVRKVGRERSGFGAQFVQLAPDVAEVFPNTESVNEALRFLIRITRESKQTFSVVDKSD
jgi:hypothetical protein